MKEKYYHALQFVRNYPVKSRLDMIKERIQYKKISAFIQRKPLTSFFGALGILFLLIIAGSFINRPSASTATTKKPVKSVPIFSLAENPKVTFQAKIEKTGVLQIIAQTAGIISTTPVKEGDSVKQGTTLITIGSNYSGANAPALQAQLAYLQYKNVLDTYDSQKDLINKQRDVANATETNAEKLREIARLSEDDIVNIINQNETILNTLNQNLSALQATNVNGANDAAILQLQQGIAGVNSGLLQIRSQRRTTDYQGSNDEAPAQLANLQKDITLRQLDIQEKALDLSKESSRIQSQLASIQASLTSPVSPSSGIVQRVFVRKGQSVTPGTPLLTITLDDNEITAVATAPKELAGLISTVDATTLHLPNQTLSLYPSHVATDATDGTLYAVTYTIPTDYSSLLTDNSYVPLSIPLHYDVASASIPFIPIDAVFQTQESAYIFLIQNGKAVARNVTLGQVNGKFVEVTKGLKKGDQVILDRTVLAGDQVIAN